MGYIILTQGITIYEIYRIFLNSYGMTHNMIHRISLISYMYNGIMWYTESYY